ncbi:hypothetical protein F4825DRAFT_473091 [Nemania diffusa]|nr:hypothetical protein F4825DRAFT_473091 [Nemania diffusa]
MSNLTSSALSQVCSLSAYLFPYFRNDVSPLMRLPAEVVFLVLEHLGSADAACFAVTCHYVFDIAARLRNTGNKIQLDPKTKDIFLPRLERDVPGLVYSHYWKRLLPFDASSDRAGSGPFYRRDIGHPGRYFAPMIHDQLEGVIIYEQTRLARNYRLFGPKHGIPLSTLSGRKTGPMVLKRIMGEGCEMHTEVSRAAKWVGEDLFISCSKTTYLKQLEGTKIGLPFLQQFIENERIAMCPHSSYTMGQTSYCDNDIIVEANVREIYVDLWTKSTYTSSGSCKFCVTDWESMIWRSKQPGMLGITHTTYHNIGSCCFPFDLKWEMATNYNTAVLRGDGYGGRWGDLKRQWTEPVGWGRWMWNLGHDSVAYSLGYRATKSQTSRSYTQTPKAI